MAFGGHAGGDVASKGSVVGVDGLNLAWPMPCVGSRQGAQRRLCWPRGGGGAGRNGGSGD